MDTIRQFSFFTVIIRMSLALLAGGVIGYGRTKKNRTAGLRTFMLTAIGASLSILLAIYEYQMMQGQWADIVSEVGMKFDASRFGSQVLSGMGFLAAGSIIAVDHQQVQGLTTATGLFAAVCMGLAAGAGFYVCVIVAIIMIIAVLDWMVPLEFLYKRRTRIITLFVEFDAIESIGTITDVISHNHASIQDMEVERMKKEDDLNPSVIINIKLPKENSSHSDMLASIAELNCVYSVEELIA